MLFVLFVSEKGSDTPSMKMFKLGVFENPLDDV